MIKLHNISKYYQGKTTVIEALRKINLEFKIGEFVAITGESGSGKSTLLNVIAGIDSYEEGELYINGEETSHFDDDDWEDYRKENIAFIFQNYNLIDSYTVLKNVEVALVMQGINKSERKAKAIEILKRVGLGDHLSHRASKLSGGKKQRLAIARALAKDTDIIVADEPTGNLDSKSGMQVLSLLKEIAKDKLVIVVTHNFDQIKGYITRKVRLLDGEVVEDKVIKEPDTTLKINKKSKKENEYYQALTIARYNIFSQPRKSIFIFILSFMIVLVVALLIPVSRAEDIYTPTRPNEARKLNIYPERMIVSRQDKLPMTDDDFNLLENDLRIAKLIKEDFAINDAIGATLKGIKYAGYFTFNLDIKEDALIGRLPENDNEVLIQFSFTDEEMKYLEKNVLDKTIDFSFWGSKFQRSTHSLKVVGINQINQDRGGFYTTDSTFEKILEFYYEDILNRIPVRITDKYGFTRRVYNYIFEVDETLTSYEVKINQTDAYIFEDDNLELFYKSQKLEIVDVSDEIDFNSILISPKIKTEIHNIDIKQVTVNLKDVETRKELEKDLLELGYYTYMPYFEIESSNNNYYEFYNTLYKTVESLKIILIIFIVYIVAYLIYRLIMQTKYKDYIILRLIGIKKSLINKIIQLELLFSIIISYIIFVISFSILRISNLFKEYDTYIKNLTFSNYLLIFVINILLGLLLANRFIKKRAKNTLYSSLRLE